MKALALVACALLTGCSAMFPSTAAAIAPATLDDLMLGLAADVETWASCVGDVIGWIL